MSRYKITPILLLTVFVVTAAYAKDQPAQVIVWPESGTPVLRLSFSKFKEVGASGSQHNYTSDTTAENLWGKLISRADFSLYLFDKNKVRIGEGWISLSNVGVREVVKFQTSVSTTGTPVSIALAPRSLPDELQAFLPVKSISITVNSVPQGAELKVDGTAAGATPKVVKVGPGKHVLEFSKEGFNTGKFPMEIGPDDASGGSVSFELGTSAHDTIELRDGSLLSGDLVSVSGMEIVIKVGGTNQSLNRNQVKRILLVERESPAPANP
jgi:PEGA domain